MRAVWWAGLAIAAGAVAGALAGQRSRRGLGASELPAGATFLVQSAAEAIPRERRFSGRKIFISDVHREVQRRGVEISLDDFKQELVRMHRDRNVVLARADFVAAMDPERVARSETRTDGATFHFLVLD